MIGRHFNHSIGHHFNHIHVSVTISTIFMYRSPFQPHSCIGHHFNHIHVLVTISTTFMYWSPFQPYSRIGHHFNHIHVPGMSHVRSIINSWPTAVPQDTPTFQRNKVFLCECTCVVCVCVWGGGGGGGVNSYSPFSW